jgi:hypothetical protein
VAIDYWKLVKEFGVGDHVQRYAPGQGGYSMSPFMGRVTTVHRGLGVLDVQWPYGNERMFPDDVVRVDPRLGTWLPPEVMDQTYMTWDTAKARELWASSSARRLWRATELPQGFYIDLSRIWASKTANTEVDAYDTLWRKYAAYGATDEAIKSEVAKFYMVASNLAELRIQQFAMKSAAYWVAQNRQYRVTQEEHKAGKPVCPKCGTVMRRTTYKMDKGARARLFACPKDLFLVKQTDIMGPDGQPVTW